MNEKPAPRQVLSDPDFQALMRQKKSISTILTVVIMTVYFGFMGLIAFNPGALSAPVANGTLGIPLGIGVIILAWILTGIYVRWANSRYDTLVEKVKQKIGD